MELHFLLPLQPKNHLPIFIFVICCSVCFFGKINMKSFCELCVVTICCSKLLDEMVIVCKKVKLHNSEVFTYPKINKNFSIGIESLKCIVKQLKCLICMSWILSKICKIQGSSNSIK